MRECDLQQVVHSSESAKTSASSSNFNLLPGFLFNLFKFKNYYLLILIILKFILNEQNEQVTQL